jgi:hypothetical protein
MYQSVQADRLNLVFAALLLADHWLTALTALTAPEKQ